jgi:hypothetical protein
MALFQPSSGSNVFGNSLANTQTFTGSLNITGSQTIFGNLGIGAAADNTYQGITIYGSNPSLRLKGIGASAWNWIEFATSASVNNFSMGVNQTTPQFVIKAGAGLDSPNFTLSTAGVATFTGNVGIGTTSPIAKLNVFGTSGNPSTTADTYNLFSVTGNLGPQLNIGGYNGASYGMWMQVKDAGNGGTLYPILLQPLGGNVGIGLTSPQSQLHMNGVLTFTEAGYDTARLHTITHAHSAGSNPNNYIGFNVSDGFGTTAERMRINGGGNVGIGTASPVANDGTSKTLQLGSRLIIQDVIGTQAMFSNNAYYDGTWKYAATATARAMRMGHVDGFSFHTTGSGTAEATLTNWDTTDVKMVILNSGNVGVGTISPGALLHVEGPSVSYGQARIINTGTSGEASINIGRSGQAIDNRWTIGQGVASIGDSFGFYTGGGNKATLTTAGVWSTTGGGTSDLRTKQDVDYIFDNGIESILKLQPTKFKFKEAPDKQRRGFIAQDVLEVIPDLVLGDGELEGGTYGLDYDGILALAVKAIQELQTRITQLENK